VKRELLPNIVVIDDDPVAVELVQSVGELKGIEVVGFTNPVAGLEHIGRNRPDIVLLDLNMPELHGLEVLQQIMRAAPSTDVILTTGDYSTDSAVRALQLGASDYWTKPYDIERLRDRIDAWLEEQRKQRRMVDLEVELTSAYQFHGMIGRSPLLIDMFVRMRRIASHFQTVLIRGETGTGKELVANTLHKLSPRATHPMIVCNCAALVDSIVESELFGYVKGAFTGAGEDRQGLIEAADGGTLFLDEVGELPLATQAKLLRVLQNREVRRVGAARSRIVDVHIIAATHKDLRTMITEGTFREDFYYRLAMVEIRVPSLSERREDLPLLIRHFLDKYARQYGKTSLTTTRRTEILFANYSWPGNIREVEHVIGSCALVCNGEVVDVGDLPQWIVEHNLTAPSAQHEDEMISLAEMDRRHAKRVLAALEGNMTKAAEVLGIGRTTLYRLLRSADTPDEAHGAVAGRPEE
jgi:DNA-binding NtrC family response regulator